MDQDQIENLIRECDELRAENLALRRRTEELTQQLQAQQRDRQLLGYELHDGLVQELTAAAMFLGTVEQQVTTGAVLSPETLRRGIDLVRRSVLEARQLIGMIVSPGSIERGSTIAFAELVERFRAEQQLDIDLQQQLPVGGLSADMHWTVQRILQEALNNVARHSGTQRVEIKIAATESDLEASIHDFGAGFDPDGQKPNRYGLAGIRQRAKLAGGSATIDSAPGQGTTVSIRLPLKPSE